MAAFWSVHIWHSLGSLNFAEYQIIFSLHNVNWHSCTRSRGWRSCDVRGQWELVGLKARQREKQFSIDLCLLSWSIVCTLILLGLCVFMSSWWWIYTDNALNRKLFLLCSRRSKSNNFLHQSAARCIFCRAYHGVSHNQASGAFSSRLCGITNYHFLREKKEIRKSMNFKQDSERKIKRERRAEQARVTDLTCTQHQSRTPPVSSWGDLK